MDKNKIIDYLYGEMTSGDRKDFEFSMRNDPQLAREIEDLQSIRGFISNNLELEKPANPSKITTLATSSSKRYRWWLAAASIILLLGVSYISGIRCSWQEGNLIIGHHQNSQDKMSSDEKYLTAAEMQHLLSEFKQDLNTSWKNSEIAESKTSSTPLTAEEVKKMLFALENRMRKADEKLYTDLQTDQAYQLDQVFTEFLDYYELTRQQDLNLIHSGITELTNTLQENGYPFLDVAFQPTQ